MEFPERSACLPLCTALADPARRLEAIDDLARLLGVEAFLVFIRDPDLEILLPAPGWPQTLPGRRAWGAFLARCEEEGRYTTDVPYPDLDTTMQITGLRAADGSVLALLGGEPDLDNAAETCLYLPMLAAALRGEHAGKAAAEHARIARETAAQLNTLAAARDATRLALQQALTTAAQANERMKHELTERRRAEKALKKLNETLELRVAERTAQLEETNEQLRAEVAERSRAEKALEQMNEALHQSNRDLQEFAYAASHDLQEPLRKITTFAGLLQEECGGDVGDTGDFYLERIVDAALRMTGLIQDLLTLSRVSTQGEPFQKIDLNEVLAGVLSDLEVRIDEVDGRVTAAPLPSIEADATQMHQLFQNLIGNALKFHRPQVPPVIQVHAKRQRHNAQGKAGETYLLTIEDNGIGFEARYTDRIFTPFQRLHGRSSPYKGTGMGLAICRHIVERHGGTITARATPGKGATFLVTLPRQQATPRLVPTLPTQTHAPQLP